MSETKVEGNRLASPITVQKTGAAPQMLVLDATTNDQKSTIWMQTAANNGGMNISANLTAVDTYHQTNQGASRISMQSAANLGSVNITASSVNNAALTNVAMFTDTGCAIKGTITNDSATAGNVGEYVSSWVNFTNAPTSSLYGDLTSISLTAGDWDVSVITVWLQNGASITGHCMAGVSITSGNSSTGLINGDTLSYTAIPTANIASGNTVPPARFSLSATTTIYLKLRCGAYTSGPPQMAGRISARRVR